VHTSEEGKSRFEDEVLAERNTHDQLKNQFQQHVLAMESRYHNVDLITRACIN
jgi:hypothetical protein